MSDENAPASESPNLPSPADEQGAGEELLSEGGMGTAREELEMGGGEALEPLPGEEDKGGGAIYPILRDEDMPSSPGAPQAEMQIPPAEAAAGAPLFSDKAYDEPGPTEAGPAAPLPGEAKPHDPAMVALLVSDDSITELWQRADKAKQEVDKTISTLPIARALFDLIKAARNELMAGRENYEEAERFINEVEYRTQWSVLVKQWSQTVGLRLFFYELAWAILLVILALLTLRNGYSGGQAEALYIFTTMVWGGFGGVVGAWFALVKHIAKDQDFDIQHTIWYIYTPPMGMALGLVVWAIMRSGLMALTGASGVQSPLLIYLFAWLSGYQHNVFTDVIKRVIKVFETTLAPAGASAESAKPAEAGQKPAKGGGR